MKLGIGLKLGFWLALLGIFSTAVTGYYAYYNSRQLLIKASQDKLLTATQVLAHHFTFTLDDIDADVRFVAALPQVQQIANGDADAARTAESKKQLAGIVSSLLTAHPEYFQIRLIGAKNSGRELVRVDRDETGLSAVSGSSLQEKGHFDYVFESMRLPAGAIYTSKINLNRELGAHHGFDKPTIRIATPVKSSDGKTFGIVVINVDLNGMFDQMRSDITEDIKVLLTNGDGDYLIHPDTSKTFGFDLGRRVLIQDDIKETKRILDGKQDNVVLNTDDKDGAEQASAAAFVRVPYGAQGDQRFVIIGLVAPLKNVLSESRALGFSIIKITLLFILLTIVIALLLSRVLARPLNQMARAVSQFSAGKPISDLPVQRTDEIGLLARNFYRCRRS
ncbi:HAMP domain-containing protein [Undibacterium arcticum]|uniref:HAMP domain-containing protein n=1 Tax=Undibacterium arcticum TaxID=1762892 RepID=UPI00361B5DC9